MKLDRFSMTVGALFPTIALGLVASFGPAVSPSEAEASIAAGPTIAVISGTAAVVAPPTVAAAPPLPVAVAPAPPVVSTADQQIAEVRRALQDVGDAALKALLLAVSDQVREAGLHDLDESIAGGKIPTGALGKVRRARVAVDAVVWPTTLQETAKKLSGELARLEPALRDESVERAATPAKNAHEAGDDLSDQVYGWLSAGRSGGAH